jgi:hypothetical protein
LDTPIAVIKTRPSTIEDLPIIRRVILYPLSKPTWDISSPAIAAGGGRGGIDWNIVDELTVHCRDSCVNWLIGSFVGSRAGFLVDRGSGVGDGGEVGLRV